MPIDPVRPPRFWRSPLGISLIFIIGFTVVTTLVVVWYARANTEGVREWADTRRDLAARGESLDAATFIPPPIPDDQNLAMSPLFVWLYQYRVDPVTGLLTFGEETRDGSAFVESLGFGKNDSKVSRPTTPPGWKTGHPTDLKALQHYYRAREDFPPAPSPQSPAEDVLLALTRFAPTLDEIARDAAERPLLRMPINWTQRPAVVIRKPHYTFFLALIKTIQLRAHAELASNRTDEAFLDMTLGLRLVRDLDKEPLLISHLVAMTCAQIQMEPIWNGLAERRWSPAQLAEIQAKLQEIDTLAGFQKAVRSERAMFFVPMVEQMHAPDGFEQVFIQSTDPMFMYDGNTLPWYISFLFKMIPPGWAEKSVAILCRKTQTYVIDSVSVTHHRLDAPLLKSLQDDPVVKGTVVYNVLTRITLPVFVGAGRRTAQTQTYLDEAATACALERFYLEHQSYPDNLGALVPAYLPRVPNDVISGGPLRYERTQAGRYRLWSVGWDEKDDAGKVGWHTGAKPLPDETKGDWVWQYEPLSPP